MLRTILRVTVSQNKLIRTIHTSSLSRLKEIYMEKKDEKTTVFGGRLIKSPREPFLLKTDEKSEKCPLCQLRLNLKYTDVLILSQFMTTRHTVMPYKATGLCRDQYKLVKELIYMAQYAGLLPEPEKEEPKKPYQLLNTYYDETTIVLRPKRIKHTPRFFYLKQKLGPTEMRRIQPDEGYYYGK